MDAETIKLIANTQAIIDRTIEQVPGAQVMKGTQITVETFGMLAQIARVCFGDKGVEHIKTMDTDKGQYQWFEYRGVHFDHYQPFGEAVDA